MTLNELDLLKQRADQMGIPYKSNIGIDALKAKIEAKLAGEQPPADGDDDQPAGDQPEAAAPKKAKSRAEIEQDIRDEQAKEQMKLIRCRITCLNPAKAAIKGEIITVANRYVGTVRKFVPFGEATDNGYHIPQIMLNELKTRKFNSVTTKKGENGQLLPIQRMVPEFAIEILEPLTMEELGKLAATQMAAAGLD